MYVETFLLWEETPGTYDDTPTITYYRPDICVSNAAVVIFPGGGYTHLSEHEGMGYAEFLAQNGVSAFVVKYRYRPHYFPLPLLDARRGVRFVRYYAEKFGVDKNKVAVMGSSAGGHLAALVSTYTDPIDFEEQDEIDNEDFLPNKQILCYPVINLYDKNYAHIGSGDNLIGTPYTDLSDTVRRMELTPTLLISSTTPEAFIWHTFEDNGVSVKNSLEYASRLRDYGIAAEMHIFPHGRHGLGLTEHLNALECHVAQWGDLLVKWLRYIGW